MAPTLSNNQLKKAFNTKKSKPFVGCSELRTSKPYRVIKMFRKQTKFGLKPVIEMEEINVYLPIRYNDLTDEEMEGIGNGCFNLIRKVNETNKNFELELEEIPIILHDDDDDFFIPNAQPFFNLNSTQII